MAEPAAFLEEWSEERANKASNCPGPQAARKNKQGMRVCLLFVMFLLLLLALVDVDRCDDRCDDDDDDAGAGAGGGGGGGGGGGIDIVACCLCILSVTRDNQFEPVQMQYASYSVIM